MLINAVFSITLLYDHLNDILCVFSVSASAVAVVLSALDVVVVLLSDQQFTVSVVQHDDQQGALLYTGEHCTART